MSSTPPQLQITLFTKRTTPVWRRKSSAAYGVHVRRYVRSVADFIAGGRLFVRYLLTVGEMANGINVVFLADDVEATYRTGFSMNFWRDGRAPLSLVLSLTVRSACAIEFCERGSKLRKGSFLTANILVLSFISCQHLL